jgi:hypothetical protein
LGKVSRFSRGSRACKVSRVSRVSRKSRISRSSRVSKLITVSQTDAHDRPHGRGRLMSVCECHCSVVGGSART